MRLLTVAEAAAELGFTETKTRHLVKRGHLPAVNIGRRVYLPADQLAAVARAAVLSPSATGGREAPKVLAFKPRRKAA